MKRYRVHIYAIVRVPVEVEAESQQDAISKAVTDTDLYAYFSGPTEYAEEISHYLVDEIGDDEHELSQWFADAARRESQNEMAAWPTAPREAAR